MLIMMLNRVDSMSNYPDDIRQYNNDPRSPFFVESEEKKCFDCGGWFDDDEMANKRCCIYCCDE